MCMFRIMKCWFRYSSHLIWGGQDRAAPYKLIAPPAKPSQRLFTTMCEPSYAKYGWVNEVLMRWPICSSINSAYFIQRNLLSWIIAWVWINDSSEAWILQLLHDLCNTTEKYPKRWVCPRIKTMYNLHYCQEQTKNSIHGRILVLKKVRVTVRSLRDIQFEDFISPDVELLPGWSKID